MLHSQVLERAFAAFIANGAVEGMAGQQEFDNVIPRFGHWFSVGANDHAVRDLDGAASLETTAEINFGRSVLFCHQFAGGPVTDWHTDFNEAHAAHADGLHLGMVAKDGDVIVYPLGGVHNNGPLGDFYLNAIYC
jgi:hypothetical protein